MKTYTQRKKLWAHRRWAMMLLHSQGYTVQQIANRFRISRQRVYQVLNNG